MSVWSFAWLSKVFALELSQIPFPLGNARCITYLINTYNQTHIRKKLTYAHIHRCEHRLSDTHTQKPPKPWKLSLYQKVHINTSLKPDIYVTPSLHSPSQNCLLYWLWCCWLHLNPQLLIRHLFWIFLLIFPGCYFSHICMWSAGTPSH